MSLRVMAHGGEQRKPAEEVYGEIMTHVVASICQDAGFSSVSSVALRNLSQMTANFLSDTCEMAVRLCEHSGRTHVTFRDVQLSLDQNGVLLNDFCKMLKFLKARPNTVLPPVTYATATAPQQSLRVGEPRPHPPHMPSFLPPFPDPHTYIHTEISGEVDSNYEKVRRLTARNKRNTENSLVGLALATRPSVSLFRDFEDQLLVEARNAIEHARQLKIRSLEARRNARNAHKLSQELASVPDPDILMNDLLQVEDAKPADKEEERNLPKELEAEELFELKDTEFSYVRRSIPDYCRVLLPFSEPRPYLSALVTEDNLDDDANHYAKILSKEIEDELADTTDDFLM